MNRLQQTISNLARPSTVLKSMVSCVLIGLSAASVQAQVPSGSTIYEDTSFTGDTPDGMEGVGVDEHLGDRLPLDLKFTDEHGKQIVLGDCFQDDLPVIITPVYFNCPMLCTLILNGLLDGAGQMDWTIGEEYRIVSYSIHDGEDSKLAAQKKQSYLELYNSMRRNRAGGAADEAKPAGWTWLTGDLESIEALNDALGYRIKRLDNGEISHPSCIMVLRPDGTINQYMNDVVFQARDLRLAMIEASDERIGSPMERFLLFTCFSYDSDSNQYVASAWKLMRTGGAITIALLAGGLFVLFRREQMRRQPAPALG